MRAEAGTVDILMATRNGGRFLRNQLLSLQQQTHRDWILRIRDDGSTDDTIAIIDEFARNDARIMRVTEGEGQGLGAGANFLGLVQHAESDFGIFCDQDDIWFERKLELLLAVAIAEFDPRLPCCVYCDGHGYSDEEGVITVPGIWRWHARGLEEFLFFNAGYQGCSLLFNRAMMDFVSGYKAASFYMHDDVVSLVGHVFGQVHFLPKRLMLYRQHDANVTGNLPDPAAGRSLQQRKDAFVLGRSHYEEKRAFFEAYREQMPARARQLFAAYLEFPQRSLPVRLYLICRWRFSLGGQRLRLLAKTLLRRPLG